MNNVPRQTLRHRHVQCGEDEFGAEMGSHRPADDSATPGVDHNGEKEKPGPGRNVRDVRNPQPVRARDRELPNDEIGRGARRLIPHGRTELLPTAHAGRSPPR
jgi:hypothetical protein